MDWYLAFLAVFLLAAVELWLAVPVGFALGLNPALVAVAGATGAIAGAWGVLLLGEHVRERLLRGQKERAPRSGRMGMIWQRYGVVGLGLLAPLLIGAPIGTAVGVALGARPKPLMLWMSAGAVLAAAVLVAAVLLGLRSLGAA